MAARNEVGIDPRAPLDYTGAQFSFLPCYQSPRRPLTTDHKEQFSLWRVGTNSPSQTLINGVAGEFWYLSYYNSTGQAIWIQLAGGSSGPALMFPVPFGTSPVVADGLGNVTFTSSLGTITITGGVNSINLDLAGGSIGVDSFQVQSITSPGVNPVVPTAAGLVTVNGIPVANHSVPIETRSRAANAYNVEVQYGTTSATTDATKSGLIHAFSGQFSLDANGFLQLVGGTAPALQKLNVDTNTGPGTDPVIPDGSGQIILTGAQVAAGMVGANVIRTNSLAANTCTIEIQRSTTAPSAASAINGVSHFNIDIFTVDTDGFVSLIYKNITNWTPTITGGTVPGATTYTAQSGSYSRIGDIVYVQGQVTWTATTGTGDITITNLPYTFGGATPRAPNCSVRINNMIWPAGVTYFSGQGKDATKIIVIEGNATAAGISNLQMQAAGDIAFTIVYQTQDAL